MKKTTINNSEIEKFSKIADEWWKSDGKFKPLHKFNPLRIQYIRKTIEKHFMIKNDKLPFKGLNILDVGCGGGLLSEPVARLGANVVGIDASSKNINIAKAHLTKSKLNINYLNHSPETLKIKKKFDIVLSMEIVEHVEDMDLYIKQTSHFLKKNGIMFIATINRTLKSYVFAIIGAEYVLRWLPIGTHQWDKFVSPEELINNAKKYRLNLKDVSGVTLNLFEDKWKLTTDKSVNYISSFIKN